MKIRSILFFSLMTTVLCFLTGCVDRNCDEKPVIYLYPEKEMEVNVALN